MTYPVTRFDDAWASADAVGGWLTEEQGRTLWHAARALPAGGTALEIGSHQGRSTIVLAHAARTAGARVVAIDPFIDGRMFGGAATRDRFVTNIDSAGLTGTVLLIADRSTALRPRWTEPLDMVFIDGKHDYWTVRDDLRWSGYLPEGAPVLIHDAFSSIGVTLGLLVHVLPGNRLRYVGRAGSLAHFEMGAPTLHDRLRMSAQLLWFVRNVAIKIALRLARLVGYRATPDPY